MNSGKMNHYAPQTVDHLMTECMIVLLAITIFKELSYTYEKGR